MQSQFRFGNNPPPPIAERDFQFSWPQIGLDGGGYFQPSPPPGTKLRIKRARGAGFPGGAELKKLKK